MEAGMDYNTVFYQLDNDEINMANAALDVYTKQPKPALSGRRRGQRQRKM